MESKALDSAIKTDVKGNQANQMVKEEKIKKTEEGYAKKEIEPERNYEAVSKNGDTLELSEDGKKMAGHSAAEDLSQSEKKVISDTGKKVSENVLAGYSEAKLRQLYRNGEISRQQYERVMKRKKVK